MSVRTHPLDEFSGVIALFETAKKHQRFPKIALQLKDGSPIELALAGNDSKGFVRATAGRLRWAQHAQTEAAIRPRGRSTRPMRRSAFVCKPGG